MKTARRNETGRAGARARTAPLPAITLPRDTNVVHVRLGSRAVRLTNLRRRLANELLYSRSAR